MRAFSKITLICGGKDRREIKGWKIKERSFPLLFFMPTCDAPEIRCNNVRTLFNKLRFHQFKNCKPRRKYYVLTIHIHLSLVFTWFLRKITIENRLAYKRKHKQRTSLDPSDSARLSDWFSLHYKLLPIVTRENHADLCETIMA